MLCWRLTVHAHSSSALQPGAAVQRTTASFRFSNALKLPRAVVTVAVPCQLRPQVPVYDTNSDAVKGSNAVTKERALCKGAARGRRGGMESIGCGSCASGRSALPGFGPRGLTSLHLVACQPVCVRCPCRRAGRLLPGACPGGQTAQGRLPWCVAHWPLCDCCDPASNCLCCAGPGSVASAAAGQVEVTFAA